MIILKKGHDRMNMYKDSDRINPIYTWPVIIIAIILFWPVGIYLIYKRTQINRKTILTTGKGVRIASYVCFFMIFCGIVFFVDRGWDLSDIVLALFFLVAGVVLFMTSKKLSVKAEKYRKYIAIVINGGECNLVRIAEIANLTVREVREDIDDMISSGYFQGAYIDERENELVIPSQKPNNEYYKPNVVVCKCCGARNIVKGSVGRCEYCDSPI